MHDVLIAEPWTDYALLDSGGGRKLERFGSRVLDRPDSQALWTPSLGADRWGAADARFAAGRDEEGQGEGQGRWDLSHKESDAPWPLAYGPVTCTAQLSAFRHVGIFPEQRVHWDFMADRARAGFSLLNLLASTALASPLPAPSGARLPHGSHPPTATP